MVIRISKNKWLAVKLAEVTAELNDAVEVLEFYGNPDTYFAIGFLPDTPCGEFMQDFSEVAGVMRPGKRARDLFEKYAAMKEKK